MAKPVTFSAAPQATASALTVRAAVTVVRHRTGKAQNKAAPTAAARANKSKGGKGGGS